MELLRSRYYDFGPTFAAEKVEEEIGRKISKEKIRELQIKGGLYGKLKRKKRRSITREESVEVEEES